MSAPGRRKRTGNVWPAITIAAGVNLSAYFVHYATLAERGAFILGNAVLMVGVRLAINAGRDGHRRDDD